MARAKTGPDAEMAALQARRVEIAGKRHENDAQGATAEAIAMWRSPYEQAISTSLTSSSLEAPTLMSV